MRSAFVLRLGSDTRPDQQHYEGWIEEVDTGREVRFRSTDELLGFLGERFESIRRRDRAPDRNIRDDG